MEAVKGLAKLVHASALEMKMKIIHKAMLSVMKLLNGCEV